MRGGGRREEEEEGGWLSKWRCTCTNCPKYPLSASKTGDQCAYPPIPYHTIPYLPQLETLAIALSYREVRQLRIVVRRCQLILNYPSNWTLNYGCLVVSNRLREQTTARAVSIWHSPTCPRLESPVAPDQRGIQKDKQVRELRNTCRW